MVPLGTRAGDAPPLVLEVGGSLDLTCETRSVVVATGAPAATSGTVELKLTLERGTPSPAGTWRGTPVGNGHGGAFVARESSACANGCPLAVAPGGEIQLWAPAAKLIDALTSEETLLIAVLKPATSEIRASTFRGQSIEALEEGRCKPLTPR